MRVGGPLFFVGSDSIYFRMENTFIAVGVMKKMAVQILRLINVGHWKFLLKEKIGKNLHLWLIKDGVQVLL